MTNIEKYYGKTKTVMPHENVKKFIETEKKTGSAIDLGCGAGRDTVFLIKNGWKVTAIDRENTKKIIEQNLDEVEKERLKFICQNFESIKLETNDLVVANFSLPFCNRDYFSEFWDKIENSISKGRILCW